MRLFLQREIPGTYGRVLEPSVGDGALLQAVAGKFEKLTVVDVCADNINKAKDLVCGKDVVFICDDFLKCCFEDKFDLIVANPPFDNKAQNLVNYEGRKISIESAFLIKCLSSLKDSGRAVFILPSSIISGYKTKWLREELVENYRINNIFKLRRFLFKKVEGSFFVLSVSRAAPVEEFSVQSIAGVPFPVTRSLIRELGFEFDPEAIRGAFEYRKYISKFGFKKLSDIAEVRRGRLPYKKEEGGIYHSTHFSQVLSFELEGGLDVSGSLSIQKYDILVKRVGRHAADSFSLYVGDKSVAISDCVVRIRSYNKGLMNSIFFLLSIRVSILLGGKYDFQVSGGGASYLILDKLKKFNVVDISSVLAGRLFCDYVVAVTSEDVRSAKRIERKLMELLVLRLNDVEEGVSKLGLLEATAS